MGNCLVHQEKLIKIIRPDGKILEYQTPTKVHQVLSDFSGFALSHQPNSHYLLPNNTQLIGGNFYYLIPLKSTQGKKKVRFTVPEEEEGGKETGLVRIKVIISKQELQEMLQNGGISVNDMVSKLQNLEKVQKIDVSGEEVDEKYRSWRPELESIPEFGEILL